MKNSFYPVLMCNDIRKEADFFIELFDFKETFNNDWYINLKDNDEFELALIDSSHDSIPKLYRKQCKGFILNIEVNDVNTVYSEVISRKKSSLLLDIKNEEFGQRHFIIETPSKILVDIIQIIPPSNEYLKNYKKSGKENEQK
ncbi:MULTISPECIES: hypothetical protein [unclassified Clostridioides]|uniref:hypothetical protein n=1 Tax=unclassified Clostridioides TaxID=2635829 RepID=UPI001D0FD8F4|nr:glyoxalase [Clostridioides sp. ES-S-0001-02]UDN60703.1 glyoxalase [Clostridioides sp. ES-W-0016-02]